MRSMFSPQPELLDSPLPEQILSTRVLRREKDFINLVSLACIQASNGVLPLFVFPHALKAVGAGLYSKVVVSEAISFVVLTLVLYSFEVEGVSRIVGLDLKKDITTISRVFSEVFYLRLAIFFVCFLVLAALGFLVDRELWLLLLWWTLLPLSYALQPFWLFLGLERNTFVATSTVMSRLICIVLVVRLVKTPADYYLVPAIIGSCFVLGGLFSLAYALARLNLRFCAVSYGELVRGLNSGKEIFLGNASVLLYRDINVLLLTFVGGSQQAIAAYSISEKMVKSIQATVRPLNQLFFPKALLLSRNAERTSPGLFRKLLDLTVLQLAAVGLLVGGIAVAYLTLWERVDFIRNFPARHQIALLVLIMVVAVFFGIANFMFGTAGLNQLGERAYYFRSILTVGLLNIAICASLAALFGSVGASISFALSEILLFALVARKYVWIGRP
jgi:O-antigen/teichoic acid export membrane protein